MRSNDIQETDLLLTLTDQGVYFCHKKNDCYFSLDGSHRFMLETHIYGMVERSRYKRGDLRYSIIAYKTFATDGDRRKYLDTIACDCRLVDWDWELRYDNRYKALWEKVPPYWM